MFEINSYYINRQDNADNRFDIDRLRKAIALFYVNQSDENGILNFKLNGGEINHKGKKCISKSKLSIINTSFQVQTGIEKDIYPFDNYLMHDRGWTIEQLYTVIEFMYMFSIIGVSQSERQSYNTIEDLIAEIEKRGRAYYVEAINYYLQNYDKSIQLSIDGYVCNVDSNAEELINTVIETNATDNIDSLIIRAKSKFTKINSTIEDKKDAIKDLGDVLERIRDVIYNELLPNEKILFNTIINKSENLSFEFLNNYNIRHNNLRQKNLVDKEIFYKYMFYEILNLIIMKIELKQLQDSNYEF